jgi:hypothetical protein
VIRERRRRSGATLVEALVATLLLSLAATATVVAWSTMHQAPRNKLMADRALAISMTEIERIHATGFVYTSTGTTIRWYDRNGAWLGPDARTGIYRSETVVSVVLSVPTGDSDREMLEARVRVTDVSNSNLYRESRTVLVFGGI